MKLYDKLIFAAAVLAILAALVYTFAILARPTPSPPSASSELAENALGMI